MSPIGSFFLCVFIYREILLQNVSGHPVWNVLFDLFLFRELHRHSLQLKQFYLWQCWWLNQEDGRQDSGSRLCCNPCTDHIDDGGDDLQMSDDADAVNRSLPIVENTVHGLISYQASWYYEVSKGYWWSSVSQVSFYENLVMLVHSGTWHSKLPDKMYTALNLKKHTVNTMYHRKILSVLSYYCGHCMMSHPKKINTVSLTLLSNS